MDKLKKCKMHYVNIIPSFTCFFNILLDFLYLELAEFDFDLNFFELKLFVNVASIIGSYYTNYDFMFIPLKNYSIITELLVYMY